MSLSQWIRNTLSAPKRRARSQRFFRPSIEVLEDRATPSANQAPDAANHFATIMEGASYQFAASDFHFTDPNDDPANNFLAVKVCSVPVHGNLMYNGATVVQPNDFISVVDINNGKLTFVPLADQDVLAGFYFAVQDDGGTAGGGQDLSQARAMTLYITSFNDAPDFTASNVTVDEDAGEVTNSSWASFDTGGGSFEGPQSPTYSVTNVSNPSLFVSSPTVNNAGNLTFTLVADANGTSTFDIQVQDSGGTANGGVDLSSVKTFTINVNAVNDAPDFTGSDITVDEDAGVVTISNWASFSTGGGSLESSQVPTYLVENISNPSLFDMWPSVDADGNLTFTLAPDANGTSTFDIYVQDDGGTTNGGVDLGSVHTFTVTVNPINDAPSFTAQDPYAVYDNAGAVSYAEWATFIPGGGADEASQTPTYTITNVSNPDLFDVLPSLASDGTLTYTVKVGTIGESTFDVSVQDNGGTSNGGQDTSVTKTFTIAVESVQGAPAAMFNSERIDKVIPAKNATLNLPGGSKVVVVRVGAAAVTLSLVKTVGAEGSAFFNAARTLTTQPLAAGMTHTITIYGGDSSSVARNMRLRATDGTNPPVDWEFSVFHVIAETITTNTINDALPETVRNSAGTQLRNRMTAPFTGTLGHQQLGFRFFVSV